MNSRMSEARSLEERLRAIEDRLEIYNLIAAHPLSADTGDGDYAALAYAEDGVFDRGAGRGSVTGSAANGAHLSAPGHRAAIEGGLAHFAGLPHVVVDGDTAVATTYLQVLHPHPSAEDIELANHGATKGFRIHRVSANRWELVRTAAGWKIKRRTLRPLDGSEPARDLLRRGLEPYRKKTQGAHR